MTERDSGHAGRPLCTPMDDLTAYVFQPYAHLVPLAVAGAGVASGDGAGCGGDHEVISAG